MESHRQDSVTVVGEEVACLSQGFEAVGGCGIGIRLPVGCSVDEVYDRAWRVKNRCDGSCDGGGLHLLHASGTKRGASDQRGNESRATSSAGHSYNIDGGRSERHSSNYIGHPSAAYIDTYQIATSNSQHDHRSGSCTSLPDILYTGNGDNYYHDDEERVPASSQSHENSHEFKLIADERVPAWQKSQVVTAEADEEVRLIEERVPAARSWDMTRCTGNFTTSCVLKGKGDNYDSLEIEDGRHFERGRRRKRELTVHGGDGCERIGRHRKNKEQILADFARFEWPSQERDEGLHECPSLVASNASLLSACSASTDAASLQCFLADLHFDHEGDETSTTERDGRALRDTIAKLKASGAGMKSLDPKLLQHLRSAHSSWRRSSSQLELPTREAQYRTPVEVSSTRETTGECRSTAESLETRPMRVRTLAVAEPSADEIIDALDDAFQPTILRRKSEASNVSETEASNR